MVSSRNKFGTGGFMDSLLRVIKLRNEMKEKVNSALAVTLLAFIISGCYSTYSSTQTVDRPQSTRRPMPEMKFYVDTDGDGTFDEVQLEKKPEPKQGSEQWTRDFYGSIRYPASARQNGIGGIVILGVTVDESGKIQNVGVKQGISRDCDEEAKRAFIYATQQGYSPLKFNSSPVKFKVELPVGFWLN